mgnify:FL=1|tara:strand:- start:1162 stop:1722 length:561 start_codon:yes stop_codon:yes gene_type:complete
MQLPIKVDDVRHSIPEILEQVSNEKFHDEKIKILQLNENDGLKIYLKALLHPNITFKLPRGAIPGIKGVESVEGEPDKGLYQLMDLHYFINGTPTCEQQNNIQRERKFMEFCDTLTEKELEALVNLKDKNRSAYPGIYDQCVNEAFPEMFSDEEKNLLDPNVPKPKPGPKTGDKPERMKPKIPRTK